MKTLAERYSEFKGIEQRDTLDEVAQMWKSNAYTPTGDGPTTPYSQSAIVHACVNAITKNVVQVPFIIKTAGAKGKPVEKDHPVAKVFRKPNPLMSELELFGSTEVFLNTTGNCLWVPRFNAAGDLIEIWTFGKRHLDMKMEKGEGLFWKVKWFGEEEIFSSDEVIHFRYFNPNHPVWGITPLEAARSAVLQEWYANKYNEAFFQNHADPGVVLVHSGKPSKPDREALRESWDARHQGFGRARRTALLWGGVDVKELKQANRRDMQFLEQKKMNREEVLMAYRVPPIEVGLMEFASSRVESQKAQRIMFGEEVLWPELNYLQKQTNYFFDTWDLGVQGEWDTSEVAILQESFTTQLIHAERLQKLGFPLNQIIKTLKLDMQPVSWGDEWFIPSNMMPASTLLDAPIPGANNNTPTPKADSEKETDKKKLLEQTSIQDKPTIKLLAAPDIVLQKQLQRVFFLMRNSALSNSFEESFWFGQIKKVLEKAGISSAEAPKYIMRQLQREACEIENAMPQASGSQKIKTVFAHLKKKTGEIAEGAKQYAKQ